MAKLTDYQTREPETLPNGVKIFWAETCAQPAPRAGNVTRNDYYVPVTCPGCDERRVIRAHNARLANLCQQCQRSAAGSAAYRKLVKKLGKAKAQEIVLQNCAAGRESWAETLVAEWLTHHNFSHTRNVILDTNPNDDNAPWFTLDFVLRHGNAAIEVNGWGHNLPHRIARDERLAQHWTGKLLVITTAEIRANERAAKAKVLDFCHEALFDMWLSWGER